MKFLNTHFEEYISACKKNNLHDYSNYNSLHDWSIKNKELFWKSIWDFTKIKGNFKKPIIENELDHWIKNDLYSVNDSILFEELVRRKILVNYDIEII